MGGFYRFFRWTGVCVLAGLLFLAVQVHTVQATEAAAPSLQSTSPSSSTEALLLAADLPGFRPAAEDEVAGYLALAKRITAGLAGAPAKVAETSVFRIKNPIQYEFVISFLAYPLSEQEGRAFDALANNPASILAVLAQTAQTSGNVETPRLLPELSGIGDKSMGFSMTLGLAPVDQAVDFLWVRRGTIVQSTWIIYPVGGTPSINLRQVGFTFDQRVAEHFLGTVFRPAGEFVPEITTHIPTPLDVSTQPSVIATNLFLAALMMLPFSVVREVFTHLSAENEEFLKERFRRPRWLSTIQSYVEKLFVKRKKDGAPFAAFWRVALIILFYGLAFSLLDRSWDPISVTGLVLFINMTVAYGLVGIADDILQWRALKKWGEPAELTLRPTNILIAVASTITSRLLTLVPGLMFGTPEALDIEEAKLESPKRNTLLKISAYTYLGIGFGLWALTTLTSILQRLNISETLGEIVGGLESFLLIVFAVALENMFVQMLGLPGSFGEAVRKNKPGFWLLGLMGVTFVFFHTLINPRGELAAAMEESNVLIFLGAAGAFVIFTLGLWIYLKIRSKSAAAPPAAEEELTAKREPRRLIPAWVWLAVNVIGLTVIIIILITLMNQGNPESPESLPPALSSSPTTPTVAIKPVDTPTPTAVTPASFTAPAVIDKLCFVPSVDANRDSLDLALWRGVQVAAAQYGGQAINAVPATFDEAGYAGAVDQLAQAGCNLIVGTWSYQQRVFQAAAQANPDQHFMLAGYSSGARPDLPNLWVTEYALGEGSYLGGYLAAALSRKGIVGAFAGDNSPAAFSSVNCFSLGAFKYSGNHGNNVEIIGWQPFDGSGTIAGDLANPDKGAAIANDLISKGADIIFSEAGQGSSSTSYGAASAAAGGAGVLALGNGTDWAWATPEFASRMLTSVEARFDASTALAINALAKKQFNGAKHVGTLASGEIAFAPLGVSSERISAALVDELDQLANSGRFDLCEAWPGIGGFLNLDAVDGTNWHANAVLTIRIYPAPGGALLFTGTAATNQTGEFFQNVGVDLKPGMVVEVTDGTQTRSSTLDPLTVDNIDPGSDIITGTALPGANIVVIVTADYPGPFLEVKADESGRWQANFAGKVDITSKTFMQVEALGAGKNQTIIKLEAQ